MAVLFRFNLFQTFVGGIIGVLLGLIAGFMGGIVDSIIMRIMDGFLSFPFVLLSIILMTVLGQGQKITTELVCSENMTF